MQLLVRKITRSKWNNADDDVFELSSDAISSCLRTSKCTLSAWEIEKEEDLDEAVLALASGFDKLETIDVVILDGEYLELSKVLNQRSAGNTAVPDLIDKHHDFVDLNYYKLGLIAEHIIQRIKQEKVKRYSIEELKKLLIDAIDKERLRIDDLTEKVAAVVR